MRSTLSATPLHASLKTKAFNALTHDEVVEVHLSPLPRVRTQDFMIISSLEQLSEEMGVVRAHERSKRYAPLLTAFAILDQIGSTYADAAVTAPPAGLPSIRRALHLFCDVPATDPRSAAIYAMRNGLVHDGALTDHARDGSWRIFRYGKLTGDFIQLAATPWDGHAATLGPATTHTVDVEGFTNRVYSTVRKIRECYEDRRSDLRILQSREEIIHKYLFWDPI